MRVQPHLVLARFDGAIYKPADGALSTPTLEPTRSPPLAPTTRSSRGGGARPQSGAGWRSRRAPGGTHGSACCAGPVSLAARVVGGGDPAAAWAAYAQLLGADQSPGGQVLAASLNPEALAVFASRQAGHLVVENFYCRGPYFQSGDGRERVVALVVELAGDGELVAGHGCGLADVAAFGGGDGTAWAARSMAVNAKGQLTLKDRVA